MQLRMSVEFTAKEEDDGYQYFQVVVDNASGYDNDAGKDGNLFQKDTICFAGVVGRGYLPIHSSEITYCYNKGDITAHCGYPDEVCWPFNEKYPATQGKTECIEKK